MTTAKIIKEISHLTLAEMKEVSDAIREAMHDAEDLPDVLARSGKSRNPHSHGETQRKKYGL